MNKKIYKLLKLFLLVLPKLMMLCAICITITNCTTGQLLQFVSGYIYGGSGNTGTYLKIVVRDAYSNELVAGALVQLTGRNNNEFRQGNTGWDGTLTFTNLEPGTYLIRAWKGRRASQDSIYISGPVSALMVIY